MKRSRNANSFSLDYFADYQELRARHDSYSADDFNVDAKYKVCFVEAVEVVCLCRCQCLCLCLCLSLSLCF